MPKERGSGGRFVTEYRECVWGQGIDQSARYHTEVFTAWDNDRDFDRRVLGPTPNEHQYGYCSRCLQPMRWSVPHQRWLEWSPETDEYLPIPEHPWASDCTGIAATYCDVHGSCNCGNCCLALVRVASIEPVIVLNTPGAVVEVGLHCVTEYDLTDPHCPLHGYPTPPR